MPPKIVQSVAIFIPILGPGFAVPPTRVLQPKPEAPLSDYEKMTLEACRSSVRMFRGNPSAVWPGYNLAEQTFLVYIPEKWVLLFNPPERIEGFEACPEGWPEFGTKVLYHEGLYGDLIGELAFDFEIGGIKTVAIGLPRDPQGMPPPTDVYLAGFIVHEAFHQFQAGHFGDIPWQREERYPILARFAGETVSPEDMPRNRIYPVGAGLGYLCDFLGLEWKLSAQAAGLEFAFHLLFSQKLGAAETSAEGLATRAKEIYGYEDILKATDRQIGEYREGFSREFESFNRQPQEKLEFEFSYRGISRSRNSLDKPRFLSELRTGSNGRPRATSPSPSPDVHMKRSREAGDRQNRSLFSPFSRVWIN